MAAAGGLDVCRLRSARQLFRLLATFDALLACHKRPGVFGFGKHVGKQLPEVCDSSIFVWEGGATEMNVRMMIFIEFGTRAFEYFARHGSIGKHHFVRAQHGFKLCLGIA